MRENLKFVRFGFFFFLESDFDACLSLFERLLISRLDTNDGFDGFLFVWLFLASMFIGVGRLLVSIEAFEVE
jgi:hypothetical protein